MKKLNTEELAVWLENNGTALAMNGQKITPDMYKQAATRLREQEARIVELEKLEDANYAQECALEAALPVLEQYGEIAWAQSGVVKSADLRNCEDTIEEIKQALAALPKEGG